MFLNLILGAIAGYLAPRAEPQVRAALENLALTKLPLDQKQYDILALIILLLGAAILALLFGGGANAIALLIGALVGLFGKQIYEAVARKSSPAENPGTGHRISGSDADADADKDKDE